MFTDPQNTEGPRATSKSIQIHQNTGTYLMKHLWSIPPDFFCRNLESFDEWRLIAQRQNEEQCESMSV